MKFICFPYHPPYQVRQFQTGDEYYIVDNYAGIRWMNPELEKRHVGGSTRDLPSNAHVIDYGEMVRMIVNEEADALLLQTPEHIRWFHNFGDIPKIFSWPQSMNVPHDVVQCIGDRPLAITTCMHDHYMFRHGIDRFIEEGHDPNEIKPWNGEEIIPEFLFPINRFKGIGKIAHTAYIVGYDWRSLWEEGHIPLTMCGINDEYREDYHKIISAPHYIYKKLLSQYGGVLQPSIIKHRSFVVSEAMLAGNIVVARKGVEYALGESLLKNWVNSIICDTKEEVRQLWKSGFMNDIRLREEIGEAARETIIDKLPLSCMIEGWQEFYEHSLNQL